MNAWNGIISQFMRPMPPDIARVQMEPAHKKCTRCGAEKSLSDFYMKGSQDSFRYSSQCKACELEKHKIKRDQARALRIAIAARRGF